MNLEPFQQRVIEESSELAEKLRALQRFSHTDVFKALTRYEQGLLERQALHMQAYLDVLRARITSFHRSEAASA